MKTEAELKKLSEYAAEFLKKAIKENSLPVPHKKWQRIIFYRPVDPDEWLNNYETSPTLAHLAKREMEKREYLNFTIHKEENGYSASVRTEFGYSIWGQGDSEYEALWTAIEASGEK